LTCCSRFFCLYAPTTRALPPFPTRRSSDLGRTYGRHASGTVLKDGEEIRTRTVPEAVAHGIAYVTEDRKHYGLNLIDTINRNISDRKSTRLNSSHVKISYAVFCLKKKTTTE